MGRVKRLREEVAALQEENKQLLAWAEHLITSCSEQSRAYEAMQDVVWEMFALALDVGLVSEDVLPFIGDDGVCALMHELADNHCDLLRANKRLQEEACVAHLGLAAICAMPLLKSEATGLKKGTIASYNQGILDAKRRARKHLKKAKAIKEQNGQKGN